MKGPGRDISRVCTDRALAGTDSKGYASGYEKPTEAIVRCGSRPSGGFDGGAVFIVKLGGKPRAWRSMAARATEDKRDTIQSVLRLHGALAFPAPVHLGRSRRDEAVPVVVK